MSLNFTGQAHGPQSSGWCHNYQNLESYISQLIMPHSSQTQPQKLKCQNHHHTLISRQPRYLKKNTLFRETNQSEGKELRTGCQGDFRKFQMPNPNDCFLLEQAQISSHHHYMIMKQTISQDKNQDFLFKCSNLTIYKLDWVMMRQHHLHWPD